MTIPSPSPTVAVTGGVYVYMLMGELDSIVVGAWNEDTITGGTDSGKAYVYIAQSCSGTWAERAILTASNGAAGD